MDNADADRGADLARQVAEDRSLAADGLKRIIREASERTLRLKAEVHELDDLRIRLQSEEQDLALSIEAGREERSRLERELAAEERHAMEQDQQTSGLQREVADLEKICSEDAERGRALDLEILALEDELHQAHGDRAAADSALDHGSERLNQLVKRISNQDPQGGGPAGSGGTTQDD